MSFELPDPGRDEDAATNIRRGPSSSRDEIAAQTHGPARLPHFEPGRGWVRSCLCGREFVSEQDWQHVPAFYDHLATVPTADVYVDAPVGITLDCEPRA